MTTKEYIETVKQKYPNTYIGIEAYYKNKYPDMISFITKYGNVPLDYMIALLINYAEYRNVNFLDALCNLAIDNVADNHETLRMKTVTNIIYRLEKHITPAEGLPF